MSSRQVGLIVAGLVLALAVCVMVVAALAVLGLL